MHPKHIVITGASSGIGEASFRLLALQQYHITAIARRIDKLNQIKETLQEQAKIALNIKCLQADVSQIDAVKELTTYITSPVDVLINNAGLALGKDLFADANMEDWEQMINTNIKGVLYITKSLLPMLEQSSAPHIINIGSISGINPYEGGNVYCATKAAVKSLSENMRIDLLHKGIKVTNIQPGAVETEFSSVRFKGNEQKASSVYNGITPLTGGDIAHIIQYCIEQPKHVCLNEITVTCLQQANAYYTHR